MKIIQNRKEWRHETVMGLIASRDLCAEEAVSEAKKIEKFVFQGDITINIKEIDNKEVLKKRFGLFCERRGTKTRYTAGR